MISPLMLVYSVALMTYSTKTITLSAHISNRQMPFIARATDRNRSTIILFYWLSQEASLR